MTEVPFAQLLHRFFHQWLAEQRNASHHTVISYRDTWRLFLRHAAAAKKKAVDRLRLSDLTATEVLAFLKHLEDDRKVSIGTRNCRLAAIHSFFSFLMSHEPLAAGQCAEVLRVPVKRAAKRELAYLEDDEVAAILSTPDRATIEGQRDHTLLAFLYNTGARIQEALDLCPRAMRWEAPAQVRLMGKECHSYCISLPPRHQTTGTQTCWQAYDLAFSWADALLAVRTSIGLGPYTDAHGAGRVEPTSEPSPA
jgi:site-specific recombinase XerD